MAAVPAKPAESGAVAPQGSSTPDFVHERRWKRKGRWPIAGVDEVGRGPLAGPVAAAAVILDPRRLPEGLDDSKSLAPDVRERLYEDIMRSAQAVAVGFATAQEIDAINIRQATHLAMRRACAALAMRPAYLLVDGSDLPAGLICEGETIVKGDAKSLSIAAASIVAKVMRDRLMIRLARIHPGYGFDSHMGYPTKSHREAIERLGPCPHHRLSFGLLKEMAPA